MAKKITKKEMNSMIVTLLLASGTWFIIAPVRRMLSTAFSESATFIIGIIIILLTLWWYNIK